MKLLLVEHEMRPSPLLGELCRRSEHRLLSCRTIHEAADICRRQGEEIAWIVVNGIPVEEGGDPVAMLRATGCRAPVVYLSAGESAPAEEGRPAPAADRQRLTRLDLHRLLTQPGGAFARGEILFEHHAPHPVKAPPPVRRKRGNL